MTAAGAARRTYMAARAAGLARASDRGSRALARALATTALGRIPPEERTWLARIEDRRPRVTELALEIADICALWSVPEIWGRLQLRLVRELAPVSCLELGTAFGVSASYSAAALELNGTGSLVTLDREAQVLPIARQTFEELGLDGRVEQRVGDIDEVLGDVAAQLAPVDFVFMDAEHTERATVAAFEAMAPHLAEGALVVVDDISINEEMRRAWDAISRSGRVLRAVDLHRQGVVVIRTADRS
jgi:predicted O-methyltransferase YrrM